MSLLPPLSPEEAPEPTKALYQRITETIGGGEKLPGGFLLMGHVESFLQDSYMNYRKFVVDGAGQLDEKTRHALVLATVSAMNCKACIEAHGRACQKHGWSQQEVAEILAITATCTMYNLFYKFKDLVEDANLEGRSVGLRAHAFQKVSLPQSLVELINIVVSNISGCKRCTAGHTRKALDLGMTHDQIDEALKVSAVMASFATFHRAM